MASRDQRTIFQRLREMGEEQVNRLLEELLSSPRFTEVLGKTVQQAMATKGRMDRNMQTILSLLNLPSRADYKKLATKIEALQGSLVNLNIKLDRMLAAQQPSKPQPQPQKRPRRANVRPEHAEPPQG